MQIDFSKQFSKQFEKLPLKKQVAARAAVNMFLQNTGAPSLRNHALKGRWQGHCSISAGGDLRIHYKDVGDNNILFVAVGTHSQLYK
jgi:addiction module RelE/StbE family toxin